MAEKVIAGYGEMMRKNIVINLMKSIKIPPSVEYEIEYSAVQFFDSLKKWKWRSFKMFSQVVLLTNDVLRFKRRLAWTLILKWTAKRAVIVNEKGDKINVDYYLCVKMIALFLLEVLRVLPEYLINRLHLLGMEIRIKKIAVARKVDGKKGEIVYLKPGLASYGQPGGSVTHTAGVINSLVGMGYIVHFFSANGNPLFKADVNVHLFRQYDAFPNLSDVENLLGNRVFYKIVVPVLEKGTVEFIYQRYSAYNYAGFALAKKYGVPFILEFNSSIVWASRNWNSPLMFPGLARHIEHFLLKNADLVIVVSDVLRKSLLEIGVNPKNILVNPNGVDTSVFHPGIDGSKIRAKYNLDGKTVIGFIGTFGLWHGAEFLAKVIASMNEWSKIHNLHFLLIGDGQRRPKTEEILRSSGSLTCCTFAGMVPQVDAPKYLAACDILVSPHVPNPDGTDFFGSPTKLFEYMAMGKAIVASRLNQIGDILEHEKTALLAETGNIDEFRQAIMNLAKNPVLRNYLGRNARNEVCERYTWEKHTERLISKVHQITSNFTSG